MIAAFDAAAVDYLEPMEVRDTRGRPVTLSETELIPERHKARARPTEIGLPPALQARRVRLTIGGAIVIAIAGLWIALRHGATRPIGKQALGEARLVLARARAGHGDAAAAFDAYQQAVKVWPPLAQHAWVAGDVPVLGSGARDSILRGRARVAAEAWGLGARVDWRESYELDLALADTCSERRDAVARLRALKDKRSAAALRRALASKDNGCLERDAREAITFLEALP
jgi:hypothetical protein